MQAAVGDALIVRSVHQGDAERHGTITEVHGKNGDPPYVVRWQDGHETLFFPSAGTLVEHHSATPRTAAR